VRRSRSVSGTPRTVIPEGPVPEGDYEIPFGQAAIVREGKGFDGRGADPDGSENPVALAMRLAAEGSPWSLIDPRTVAPLDIETIARSVAKTGRLLDHRTKHSGFMASGPRSPRKWPTGLRRSSMPQFALNGAHTPTPYSLRWKVAIVAQRGDVGQSIRDLAAE